MGAYFDLEQAAELLITVLASLLCITIHEMSHGYAAYRLGDPTAKNAGRLSFNPLRHIDWFGLLMMVVVHVGWAKAVPVDPRNFKKPKQGMAITALAGPVSNFVLAFISWICYYLMISLYFNTGVEALYWMIYFFNYLTILSLGLGLFNLIPIPPLDGYKILSALLPEKWYFKLMRYERFGFLIVILIGTTGFVSGYVGKGIMLVVDLFDIILKPFMNLIF